MRTPGFFFLFAQPFCAYVLKILPWGRRWRHATPFLLSLSLTLCIATLCKCLFSHSIGGVFPLLSALADYVPRDPWKRERETPSIAHPSWTKSTRCQTARKGKRGERERNRIKFQASVTPARAPIHADRAPRNALQLSGDW